MKLKSLLVSLLAVSALVACNKENDGGAAAPTDGNGISVTVSIKSSGTRAVTDAFTSETDITVNEITVYFTNGANGNIVDTKIFSPEEIAAGKAVFHGINPSSTHAVVVANANSLLSPVPTSVSELNNITLTMANMQTLTAVPLKSDVSPLVENTGHVAPDDGSEDDVTVDYRKVELTVGPVLARIEIGGTLTMTATESNAGGVFAYSQFTPEYVGLNGLYENGKLGGTTTGSLITANDNQTGFPVVGTTPAWMYDAFDTTDKQDMIAADGYAVALSKVYAYNVMPGEKPVVMLRFDSKPLPADQIPGDVKTASPAYLKIVNFTDDAKHNKITIEPGKIYTIEDITFDQDKVTWLDNTVLCVEAIVTVQDWEIQDVEPEFGE